MAYGYHVVLTIVNMLNAFGTRDDISYDYDAENCGSGYGIVRVERVNMGDDGDRGWVKTCRTIIYKLMPSDFRSITPNDIMLIYKKLHREEFTCDTIAGRG